MHIMPRRNPRNPFFSSFSKMLINIASVNTLQQYGQVSLFPNHILIHEAWKVWLHEVVYTFLRFSLIASKHIEQSELSVFLCWWHKHESLWTGTTRVHRIPLRVLPLHRGIAICFQRFFVSIPCMWLFQFLIGFGYILSFLMFKDSCCSCCWACLQKRGKQCFESMHKKLVIDTYVVKADKLMADMATQIQVFCGFFGWGIKCVRYKNSMNDYEQLIKNWSWPFCSWYIYTTGHSFSIWILFGNPSWMRFYTHCGTDKINEPWKIISV